MTVATLERLRPNALSRYWARLPVRWRLASVSAVLTLLILLAFALVVGFLTQDRLRSDFDSRLKAAAADLQDQIKVSFKPSGGFSISGPNLDDYVRAEPAVVRIVTFEGQPMGGTRNAPNLGHPFQKARTVGNNRVVARPIQVEPGVPIAYVQYARPESQVDGTIRRLWAFLGLGVLGGTLLALLAGLAVARRAMSPVAGLTRAAREVGRTRDPRKRLPEPVARDEVADLARTLADMLESLAAARSETEGVLKRQRQFVADASHELRTPLTSVMANLELLKDRLAGAEPGDASEMTVAALRSSLRMRRLVGDLLLLARTDAGREEERLPVDFSQTVNEVVTELGPLSENHALTVNYPEEEITVRANRDELHQLVVNLIDNSIRHTPNGTHIEITVQVSDGTALLIVEDDGPGIPESLKDRVFDRFTRSGNDSGPGTGLGLAIVRAVAEAHGGSATLEHDDGPGARFVVRLPKLDRRQPKRAM